VSLGRPTFSATPCPEAGDAIALRSRGATAYASGARSWITPTLWESRSATRGAVRAIFGDLCVVWISREREEFRVTMGGSDVREVD
jgi:hypothetical protein